MARFDMDEPVEARSKESAQYKSGKIIKVAIVERGHNSSRSRHVYDIRFGTGELAVNVDEGLIRKRDTADVHTRISFSQSQHRGTNPSMRRLRPGGSRRKKQQSAFRKHARVEARYKGGEWRAGRVTKVNIDGTFDITFDGAKKEKEFRIAGDNVRELITMDSLQRSNLGIGTIAEIVE